MSANPTTTAATSDTTAIENGALALFKPPATRQTLIVFTDSVEAAHRYQAAWRWFYPTLKTALLPDWETLPYEHFSPHQDLVSERLNTLWQVKNSLLDVLFVSASSAMQKLAPASFLLAHTFWLKQGQRINLNHLRENLIEAGYLTVESVMMPGEFATRGSIVDIFPMGESEPFRIDLFNDEIELIKLFDPATQRSTRQVNEIRLLPAHEFPTTNDARKIFSSKWRETFGNGANKSPVLHAVEREQFGGGVEYYLPLFFEEELSCLFDYLPQNATFLCVNQVAHSAQQFEATLKTRFDMAFDDATHPPLAPGWLFLSADEFLQRLKLATTAHITTCKTRLPTLAIESSSKNPLQALKTFVATFKGRVLISTETPGRREVVLNLLKEHGLAAEKVNSWQAFLHSSAPLCITYSPLSEGFMLNASSVGIAGSAVNPTPLALITESELYQYIAKSRTGSRRKKVASEAIFRDLAEIKIGDAVVHEEHGIGRYRGLVITKWSGGESEMMMLEYANDAELFVPVAQLHLISRYIGAGSDHVPLHPLGNKAWSRAKQKAAQKAHDTAAELLNLYAKRRLANTKRENLPDAGSLEIFAAGFPYVETEDQLAAINAVIHDLTRNHMMDRLVCGDVGFGKTEVALRAAFISAMSGKQVVVLTPTTLLAEQHAKTFAERFANFPVNVARISRFNSSKETTNVLEKLADGRIDIVIGTHKLIQDNVKFRDLGLVIIDEEHRFGVRQKEAFKRLKAHVDVLTLTATPIPRTLSMALEGLRDFSLISSAPEKRLAVKTFVKPYHAGSVREAVLRERSRGGQVFFLHNEVETINAMHEKLTALLPESRIGVAHGQMRAKELEQVMRQFLQQRFDVLLCTSIIETGIDIPNANTIIINRADRFGIAQLHQLRGRVGRSHHQAYAYLFTPEHVTLDAEKRLQAIAEADELGAGFKLAMQDLEIRGAGEILGEGQSGEMMQVGFTLFSDMLKQAVRDLKNGRIPNAAEPFNAISDVKLARAALLPESYCPDVHARLVLYKRLAGAGSLMEVDDIHEELVDRFGAFPVSSEGDNPVLALIEGHRLRILAQEIGVRTIDAALDKLVLRFRDNHNLDPAAMVEFIQNNRHCQLQQDKLTVPLNVVQLSEKVSKIKQLLQQLSPSAT